MPHITHVNNILQSIFSNAEVYINNHQIYNSNGFFAHKSHIYNNFKSTLSDYKGVLHGEGYDYEDDPKNLVEGPFFTRRMKLYSRPDGFMLYGKLGIDFVDNFGTTISKYESTNPTNSSATKFLHDKREFQC